MTFDIGYLEEEGTIIVYYEMMDHQGYLDKLSDEDEHKLGPFIITRKDAEAAKKFQDYGDFDRYLEFCIGYLVNDKYVIPGRILSSNHNLIIDKDCTIETSMLFEKTKGCPAKIILNMLDKDVHIGNGEECISPEALLEILHKCPTNAEIKHYVESRIGGIVSEELELDIDFQKRYEDYLKRRGISRQYQKNPIIEEAWVDFDLERLKFILKQLQDGLSETHVEEWWQNMIADILPILFPQYIIVRKGVNIGKKNGHDREVDFILVDSAGYVDLMEVKRPDTRLLATRRERNNYVPSRKISDAALQIENYIHTMNVDMENSIRKITEKIKDELPEGLEIHILNPRGLMLIGNTEQFNGNKERMEAMEIVRRQYSHIMDIITYDDLVERLVRMIRKMEMMLS